MPVLSTCLQGQVQGVASYEVVSSPIGVGPSGSNPAMLPGPRPQVTTTSFAVIVDIAVDLVSLQAKDLLRRVVGRRQSSPPGGRASPEPGQRPRAPRSTTSSRSRAPNRSPRPAGGCRARPRCSSRRWQTARAPLPMSVAPWFS